MDDDIRHFTGKDYYYHTVSSESDFYGRVRYALASKEHPMVIDVTIYGYRWDYYEFDHRGHILVLDGFDGRYNTIRLNDPYNEIDWRPGGGRTGGHRSYKSYVVADGVMSHWRHAVIY